MKLKHIEHICLAIGFGIITGLMFFAVSDIKTSSYLFNNPDKVLSQGFSVLFFVILLGVFGVHTINNTMSIWYDRRKKSLTDTSSKESSTKGEKGQ